MSITATGVVALIRLADVTFTRHRPSDASVNDSGLCVDGVVALIRLADVTFTRHRPSDASVNDSGLCVDSRFLASRTCA
ncbi:MAG: hypothetical protein VB143_04245, partial [Burkholderia sp.]